MIKKHDQKDTRELYVHMAAVEAVLFTVGDPIKKKRLAKACGITMSRLDTVLVAYAQRADKEARGLVIMEKDDTVQMMTAPQVQEIVKSTLSDRLDEDLSRAALEVLTIVAYRSPVSRMEIDAIRGVNCAFSLRNLLMRGLIERIADPDDARAYRYRVTHDFLAHLGLRSVRELPDFATLATHPKIDQVKGIQ